jgi:hypothetical protein
VFYNFCRPHKSLQGDTPAMAAGLADQQHGLEWIVELIEQHSN